MEIDQKTFDLMRGYASECLYGVHLQVLLETIGYDPLLEGVKGMMEPPPSLTLETIQKAQEKLNAQMIQTKGKV